MKQYILVQKTPSGVTGLCGIDGSTANGVVMTEAQALTRLNYPDGGIITVFEVTECKVKTETRRVLG